MTATCFCDQCGVAIAAVEARCEACGADLEAFVESARVDRMEEFVTALRPSFKYWPFAAGCALLVVFVALLSDRSWRADNWLVAFLFFGSPLLLGLIVALTRPPFVATTTRRWEDWIAHRRALARDQQSGFAKWAVRPTLWTFTKSSGFTERLADEHIKTGIKLASNLYLIGLVIYLAFVVTVVIVTLVVIGIVLAIIAIFSEDKPVRIYGSEEGIKRRSEPETRVQAGRKGSTWIAGTNVFNEKREGRIDEQGNIIRGTNIFNEEKVGRMDKEGNVYSGKSIFSEKKTGRLNENGDFYEGSNVFNEKKMGRVDEDGNVYEGTNVFNEKKVGRYEKKD